MSIFAMVLAILAGVFTTVESTVNAQLSKYVAPSLATLHSLILGSVMIFFICLWNGSISQYPNMLQVNPILWTGGIFGAFIILFSTIAIPQIGISNGIILILTGQIVSGLVADVYLNQVEIGPKKMIGLALFIVGTILFFQE